MAASTRSIHSRQRAAAAGRRARRRGARRRLVGGGARAALIGRTAGTWAGPKTRARRQARRAGRTAGGRRGRSSAPGAPLRRARRNPRRAAGRRFWPPVSPAVWARRRSGCRRGGQDRRRGRGRRRRRARSRLRRRVGQAGSPGLGRRPPPGDRRVGSRIFVAISGTGRGQRSRMAMTMSNTQRARISASAAGASGKAENARAAALAAAETGSPSPAQAFRLDARPFGSTGQVEPRRRVGDPAGVEAGRPAGADRATAISRFAAGPSGSPTAKRRSRSAPSSALRRRILAEAAALCSARRARSAPAAGGSGRREGVEQREPGAGGEQRIALPCPSARPRPGRDRRRWRKGLPFRGFRRVRLGSRPRRGRRGNAFRTGLEAGRRAGRNRRESLAHGESLAALCHLYVEDIRPACRGGGNVR